MQNYKVAAFLFAAVCLSCSWYAWANRFQPPPQTYTIPQQEKRPLQPEVTENEGEPITLQEGPKKDSNGNSGMIDSRRRASNVREAGNQERPPESWEESNPNLIRIKGKYYYLFDENVIIPLTANEWTERKIKSTGEYGNTSEFYAVGETVKDWTQKFSMHEVRTSDTDCFEFVDKLVTGIIVTIDEQMAAEKQELSPDNLLFSFVRKDKDNTVLFWHRKGVPKMDDEIQFLRCFVSRYSRKMYLVTFTMKGTKDKMDDNEIAGYIRALEEVQELRESKNPPTQGTGIGSDEKKPN